jgi:hypothetical protein
MENLEQRLVKMELKQKQLAEFCGLLLTRIHQLDKNMGKNIDQILQAIKEPNSFDLDDCLKQIARAEFKFDQMDAALAALDLPKPPDKSGKDSGQNPQ